MPQHKSAIKRVRQNAKRRERNRYHRSRMRTLIKQLRTIEDKEQAEALLPEAKSYLDRLASKGIIHKNKAANYKSELEQRVHSL
ncbi:MAG TPA: 30S ribosomal protein S20 [Rhodothermales bacterium]|nr:30S ribosomal protein S20 [Rhodothermales bacterium]